MQNADALLTLNGIYTTLKKIDQYYTNKMTGLTSLTPLNYNGWGW